MKDSEVILTTIIGPKRAWPPWPSRAGTPLLAPRALSRVQLPLECSPIPHARSARWHVCLSWTCNADASQQRTLQGLAVDVKPVAPLNQA
eukprot:521462-Amphidinium_carterae.1